MFLWLCFSEKHLQAPKQQPQEPLAFSTKNSRTNRLTEKEMARVGFRISIRYILPNIPPSRAIQASLLRFIILTHGSPCIHYSSFPLHMCQTRPMAPLHKRDLDHVVQTSLVSGWHSKRSYGHTSVEFTSLTTNRTLLGVSKAQIFTVREVCTLTHSVVLVYRRRSWIRYK